MPSNVYKTQSNPAVLAVIVPALVKTDSDLIYTQGPGTLFATTLVDDAVQDGHQLHAGNPIIDPTEEPQFKKCEAAVNILNDTISVDSADLTRGLFIHSGITSSSNKADSIYYWDEVYTSPLGYFKYIGNTGNVTPYELVVENSASSIIPLASNILKFCTNDVNIVPKAGDFIVIQKVPSAYVKPTDVATEPGATAASFQGVFTDGLSNMPVIANTETYQFKIDSVTFTAPSESTTEYRVVIDKSFTGIDNTEYSIVLLNRENTGLEKELFYDTFEQIEVNRTQLLGDPYNNTTSTAKPLGRKNYLNYNNAEYLGLRNLLSNIINSGEHHFVDTPFIVFDIDQEIKDRFMPESSDYTTSTYNFEFHLPHVMFQEDVDNKLNILTNYGSIMNDVDGVGRYSGLYLKWGNTINKRYGWLFYDLRIIVIDDPELAVALSYNSNRNYTLPNPDIHSGNFNINEISNINLDIIGIEQPSGGTTVVIVNGKHGLPDKAQVYISGVKTKQPGTNLIQSSTANGIRYIELYRQNGSIVLDRFYIYSDSSNTAIISNGEFVNSGPGQSGKVSSTRLKHNYFMTYRIKNQTYSSILPYAKLSSFNFIVSEVNPSIDNNNGSLFLTLPEFTHLNAGYDFSQLEFIIGEWDAANSSKPFEITGIKNVVVLSSNNIAESTDPTFSANLTLPWSTNLVGTKYTISKADYLAAIALSNSGLAPYDYITNPTGDTNYDLFNNFKHYNIISGTLSDTFYTGEGKWTLGNIKYKTRIEQYRSKMQIIVAASEWNDTQNPSYDPENDLMTDKYISEVAIVEKGDDKNKPLVYAKIAPPVRKTPDLDLIITLSVDF